SRSKSTQWFCRPLQRCNEEVRPIHLHCIDPVCAETLPKPAVSSRSYSQNSVNAQRGGVHVPPGGYPRRISDFDTVTKLELEFEDGLMSGWPVTLRRIIADDCTFLLKRVSGTQLLERSIVRFRCTPHTVPLQLQVTKEEAAKGEHDESRIQL